MAVITPPGSKQAADKDARRALRRQRLGALDVKLSPYLYISPFFIIFLIVGLFPLAYTAYVSMHE